MVKVILSEVTSCNARIEVLVEREFRCIREKSVHFLVQLDKVMIIIRTGLR